MFNALVGIVHRFRSWIRAHKSQASSEFVALPAELLVEVLKLLSWKDILHVRLTCKYLSEVTKTRAIWAHLVNGYILTQPWPPRLERPIGIYTSSELEHLLLLWKSAEIGWETDDGHPARERTFMAEPAQFVHLVKGGRWLLLTTSAGAVFYYDLDAATITGVSLIPDQIKPAASQYSRIFMSIDIDTTSPMLNFKIAFYLHGQSPEPGSKIPRRECATFKIWQISLLLDHSQQAIGLSATQLSSFPQRPGITDIFALSFLGPTIAFNGLHSGDKVSTFVIEWTRLDWSTSTYPWRMLSPHVIQSSFIHLLHGNRIFITNPGIVKVFDYSMVEETTSILPSSQLDPTGLLCKICLKYLDLKTVSGCFFTENASQLNVVARRTLYTIVLKDLSSTLHILNQMDLPDGYICSSFLGSTRAVAVGQGFRTWLMRYSLPIHANEDSPPSPPAVLSKRLLSHMPLPSLTCVVMDEESGRIVFPGYSGMRRCQKAIVVDYALVFKSNTRGGVYDQ